MATAVYVEDGDCCKYFVCFAPDENKTVDVAETVVEREAFKDADGVEYVSFEKCETVEQFAFEDCRELKAVVPPSAKDSLIEELEYTNITNATVYPDMDIVAKEMLKRYGLQIEKEEKE